MIAGDSNQAEPDSALVQLAPRQAGPQGLASAVGPELALLTVVGLWASTFVVSKGLFDTVSPLAFTGVRFAAMIVLGLAILVARTRTSRTDQPRTRRIDRADVPRFLAAGLTGYTLYQLGFVLGLDRTSPFSSSLLIAMVPLFTIVFLAAIGEPTPLLGWLGLAVAIAGAVVFLVDKRGGGAGTLLGDALSLGAAVSFAIYGIVNRPITRAYPPETATGYGLFAGGLPLVLICTPAMLTQDWDAVGAGQWLAIGYMVVFPVYVAYMLWNWGIARRGAFVATGFGLLVPIVSGALSAAFFDEGFGPAKLAGAALVLAGLALTRLGSRRPPPRRSTTS